MSGLTGVAGGPLTTSSAGGLLHPEWVAGRRLWLDGASMDDVIHKLHFGDPVKGWEGDERLAVYFDGNSERWELWRLEDDNQYRFVCRTAAGIPFDDRVIDALLERDRQRQQQDLAESIINDALAADAAKDAKHSEFVREELGPRLHHAAMKDGGH